jgi:hypothetical protein
MQDNPSLSQPWACHGQPPANPNLAGMAECPGRMSGQDVRAVCPGRNGSSAITVNHQHLHPPPRRSCSPAPLPPCPAHLPGPSTPADQPTNQLTMYSPNRPTAQPAECWVPSLHNLTCEVHKGAGCEAFGEETSFGECWCWGLRVSCWVLRLALARPRPSPDPGWCWLWGPPPPPPAPPPPPKRCFQHHQPPSESPTGCCNRLFTMIDAVSLGPKVVGVVG